MYLEISARRTGKTTRLVEAVKEHLDSGGEAIVVAPHLQWLEFMKLPENEPRLFTVSGYNFKASSLKIKKLNIKRPRWFFEEFDFIKIPTSHITESGYYVTTPRFIRKIFEMSKEEIKTDVLLSLLKLNKGQYAAYTFNVFGSDSERLIDIGRSMSAKQRRSEILGIFMSSFVNKE